MSANEPSEKSTKQLFYHPREFFFIAHWLILYWCVGLLLCFVATIAEAQTPTPTPTPSPTPNVVGEVTVSTKFANTDPLYQEIRKNLNTNLGECATVNNLVMPKDRGVFTMRSGEICFANKVQDRVTGAVFIGDGEFQLAPPVEIEKKHLAIFVDAPEIKEQFTELVMYFTDKTYDQLKKSPNLTMNADNSKLPAATNALKSKNGLLRRRFSYNISSRILADFLTPQRQGFFTCFIDGKKFGSLVYQIDPLGITNVYPEQVALISYDQETFGIWTAFHLADEYKKGTANSWTDRRFYDITNHDLETTIQGTRVIIKDTLTIQMKEPDIKFIPFDLYSTMRIKTVRNEAGEEISFIQEKKDEDADFGVILGRAPEVGKPFKITVEGDGIDVLIRQGTGNFILNPGARSTWYPNNPFTAFGDRAIFNLTFHYPKKYVLVGVGNRVGDETTEGEVKTSKWSSDVEFEVAGFNYGDFKSERILDAETGYELEVYANRELPAEMRAIQNQVDEIENRGGITETTIGAMNTVGGMKMVLAEAQNSMRIYNTYFGKLPYKRIAMTQQPNTFFGQAWTTLIYMPYMAFVSNTQRVQLFGIQGGTNGFWQEVAPHEVAHQWWGHIVGWTSYHDQWMSEGFSEFSASLYVQLTQNDTNKFIEYWELQRRQLTEGSPRTNGIKPYTVGPISQGFRLNSAKTGGAYQNLIYPKGAFVLHMLRMMMFDHRKGTRDDRFKEMMKDFIKTHYNRPVSNEDFKKTVEKHMTPQMDIDGNKTMDWFFDEWVFGTEVPTYKFEYQIGAEGGKTILTGKLTQSGVSDKFVMIVPIYVDFGKGWAYLGSATVNGNSTVELKVPLPQVPKRAGVAVLHDVLTLKVDNVKK